MRVGAAALAGGLFGVAGTLCFLLAFGTDYWLVASDDCGPYSWSREETEANGTEVRLLLTCLFAEGLQVVWGNCFFKAYRASTRYLIKWPSFFPFSFFLFF